MTGGARARLEGHSRTLLKIHAVALAVFGLLPLIVVGITGLIIGAQTGDFPSNGAVGWDDTYPAFDPQIWLSWIPIAVLFVWFGATFTVPLRRKGVVGRGSMLISTFVNLIVVFAYPLGIAGAPQVFDAGAIWMPVVLFWLGVAILVRMLLGWVRALPLSWRAYPDPEAAPAPSEVSFPSEATP